ncbi:chromosome segregation ATPase [Bradyrhizobium sp. i1.4.4]
MAITTKTFLDTIVLQFSTGAEHQLKAAGELEGAHFVEVEYLVDDASGAILGRSNRAGNGAAQVLDPAKVGEYVGAQAAAMAAQIARLTSEGAVLTSQLAERTSELKEATDAKASMQSELAQLTTELAAVADEREQLKGQLAEATAPVAETTA